MGPASHGPFLTLAREGMAHQEVLRALHSRHLLPADVAIASAASQRAPVRERVLEILLREGDAARVPTCSALAHPSPQVRELAARLVELRAWAEGESPLRNAAARETHRPTGFAP